MRQAQLLLTQISFFNNLWLQPGRIHLSTDLIIMIQLAQN